MPGILPVAFHLLVKPTGPHCNLACEYCFYLSKDRLYPDSRFRMTDEILEATIKQLLSSQQSPQVSVNWQGGEPMLMGLEFYQRSIELVKKYKKPGQQVTYTIQTNGTRLDDAWCAFFKEQHFLVGLSMDGPSKMHDTYRVDKGGRGTLDQVRRGWDLLQKQGVDTNILCTVHAANADHPTEVYRFFRDDLGARFIQFIPIVEHRSGGTPDLVAVSRSPVSARSVKPEQFGQFLVQVFEEWLRRDIGTVFVQTFDSALANWYRVPASVCIFQEVCGSSLVLEHNGDLYSCDHFVGPGYCLGNIIQTPMAELAASAPQRRFGLDKRDRLPSYCRTCDVLFACRGECPRNRFIKTPHGREDGLNYLCAGYKLFFHHIDRPMRRMADLLRQGRAPAEILRLNLT